MGVITTPEEKNRQILERLAAGGDDLGKPRRVDFAHSFPDEAAATAFSRVMAGRGLRIEIERTGCVPHLPWDVVVSVDMAPELNALTVLESGLGQIAVAHGGRGDGWGCMSGVHDAA